MKNTLLIDAAINFFLGLILVFYPRTIIEFLGVPLVEQPFYASILGAVLVGIGIALVIECFRLPAGKVGLGLGGAVAINLSGGAVLAAWLIWGNLNIPLHGRIFLWSLAAVLVVISSTELLIHQRR